MLFLLLIFSLLFLLKAKIVSLLKYLNFSTVHKKKCGKALINKKRLMNYELQTISINLNKTMKYKAIKKH